MNRIAALFFVTCVATVGYTAPPMNERLSEVFDLLNLKTTIRDELKSPTTKGFCFVPIKDSVHVFPVGKRGNHPLLTMDHVRIGANAITKNSPVTWLSKVPSRIRNQVSQQGLPTIPPLVPGFSPKGNVFQVHLASVENEVLQERIKNARVRLFPVIEQDRKNTKAYLLCYQVSDRETWFDLIIRIDNVSALRIKKKETIKPQVRPLDGNQGIALLLRYRDSVIAT